MELDKKTPLEYRITKEKEQDEVKFIEGNHKTNIFLNEETEMEVFDRKVNKMFNSAIRRPDRPKSHNPMWDAMEKKIVQPEVNVIYKVEELKELGIDYSKYTRNVESSLSYAKTNKEKKEIIKDFKGKFTKEVKKESGFKIWWKAWMKQIMS